MPLALKKALPWLVLIPGLFIGMRVILSIDPINAAAWVLCGNETKDTIYSPDNTKLVSLVIRDCGATTKRAYLLVYRRANPIVQMEKNILAFSNKQNIQAKWTDNKHLFVFYDRYAGPAVNQIFKWDDVTIKYTKY
jgi:hypothetical protein